MISVFLLAISIFFVTVAVTLLTAKPLINLFWRHGILDVPGTSAHKKHKAPTPRAGGVVIAISFTIVWLFFGKNFSPQVLGALAAAAIAFAFGLVDDLRGMNAKTKILGQLIATLVLISFDVRVSILKFPGTQVDEILNILITIIWVVGITNAINLVDSADALSISLTLITSFFFLFGSIIAGQEQLAFQGITLIGVCVGLLYFNLPPARLFLGDSGTQAIGFLLASLAILYNPVTQPQASSWFVPITFVAVPIFDVCLVFFSRIRRRIAFYRSDTNHTYHRLVRLGQSPARAVWLMDLAAGLAGMIGLFALYQEPIVANVIFAGILAFGAVTFFVLEKGSST